MQGGGFMSTVSSESALFICDLANNHYGDVNHAKRVIDGLASVKERTGANIALKFQFRALDTYIHPEFKKRMDLKFINRFMSTRLSDDQYKELVQYARGSELLVISTPFDEISVDLCLDLNLDFIKIASASSNDYPLVKKISESGKPVIASTAGLRIDEIDSLVARLINKVPDLTIMHCVAIYPSEDSELKLRQIKSFQDRYKGIKIGFSTHERRDSSLPVIISTALGAQAFERHVGIKSDKYPLNDYSSEPEDIETWINEHKRANLILGPLERSPFKEVEVDTLNDLKRGIYAKETIKAGTKISELNTFFAFPLQAKNQQLHAGMIESSLTAKIDIEPNLPVTKENASFKVQDIEKQLMAIRLQAIAMLSQAGISLNAEAEIELSHHYGIERFREFGAILVTCYNNEYAKKILIQLPRQKHPYHFHKEKKETFQLLWGDMEFTVEGNKHNMAPGELLTVERGQWHKFQTLHGAIVEEVSTQAIVGDSYYEDPIIADQPVADRKTRNFRL